MNKFNISRPSLPLPKGRLEGDLSYSIENKQKFLGLLKMLQDQKIKKTHSVEYMGSRNRKNRYEGFRCKTHQNVKGYMYGKGNIKKRGKVLSGLSSSYTYDRQANKSVLEKEKKLGKRKMVNL